MVDKHDLLVYTKVAGIVQYEHRGIAVGAHPGAGWTGYLAGTVERIG